jgi:hypothetical protein
MRNRFVNPNVVSWWLWIFRKNKLPNGAIYFLSRRYATSPRFFPLFNEFTKTEIILFKGSRFPLVDRFYLSLLPIFIKIYRRKISKYSWFIALNSNLDLIVGSNMILNLDDPTFSDAEIKDLLSWEAKVISNGFYSCIVCTTKRVKDYLENNEIQSKVIVVPQGHSIELNRTSNLANRSGYLDVVYISPSIDIAGDKHAGHNMWDASTLLVDIWPLVQSDNLRLHLIGRLGKNASAIASDKRIIPYGLLSVSDCANLLPSFDLALYPRKIDNGWLPQKLIEYIGAGLPILGFRLIDTEIVENLGVGVLVGGVEEFARRLDDFCKNTKELELFRMSAKIYATQYSWKFLAGNFEEIYTLDF